MAAQRVGRRVNRVCGAQSPGSNLQRRQARITVKYNRKELQRRLDVEKWIDCGLDELYRGRVSPAKPQSWLWFCITLWTSWQDWLINWWVINKICLLIRMGQNGYSVGFSPHWFIWTQSVWYCAMWRNIRIQSNCHVTEYSSPHPSPS